MISERTITAVRERANIVDVVGEVTQLRRQGSSYIGLCPFHAEKTPSFHVRDDERYFHCFGCGESGNVITFIMKARGLSFVEAVEELAGRYNIEIERDGGPKREKGGVDRNVFLRINALAAEYFRRSLERSGDDLRQYLAKRGLSEQAITTFGIGYAPPARAALTDLLRSKKTPDDVILASGLARRNVRGEIYDVFRGRLIFPVYLDPRRIAGFGGRLVPGVLPPESTTSAPKYLNSPETPIYQKSKILFGIPQAMETIRATGSAYLVEGYMDVVGLWQGGVRNAVATCGTALTERHVKRLAQLAKRVTVLFDGDAAGRAAAGKCWPLFLNAGIDVQALFIPSGADPDDVAREHGGETARFLDSLPRQPLIDCYIESLLQRYGVSSARELGAALKGKAAAEIVQQLARVSNRIERSELTQRAAFLLGVEADELERMSIAAAAPRLSPRPGEGIVPAESEGPPAGGRDEPERGPLGRREASALPRLDQELLYAIMAKKESLCEQALRDPDLCVVIDPDTRAFIEELRVIIAEHGSDEERAKARIKGLLKLFGESWIAHWRLAYTMLEDPAVKFEQVFEQCKRSARKFKLNQILSNLLREQKDTLQEERKTALYQEILSMQKRLREL